MTTGLVKAGQEHGFHLIASGMPSLFYLRIADDDSLMLHQEWVADMVRRGIFLTSHHNHFINASLTHEDINHTIEVAEECFKILRKESSGDRLIDEIIRLLFSGGRLNCT